MDYTELKDQLISKIKILNETIWENRVPESVINQWLDNFTGEVGTVEKERIHALFALSEFMYFGNSQIRECLKSLYRDLYRYPIIEQIRRTNGDTTDTSIIQQFFKKELSRTRFIGVGNPSESGCHLLYYFRQENNLSKKLFIHCHEIFERAGGGEPKLADPDVCRYVFIDDLCGSGSQCKRYSKKILQDLRSLSKDNNIYISYFPVFATEFGLNEVNEKTEFNEARSVFVLDDRYKVLTEDSLAFKGAPEGIDREFAAAVFSHYGESISKYPLGFGDGQYLLGFQHNTPNNSLPVVWSNKNGWKPVFKRYSKIYYGI